MDGLTPLRALTFGETLAVAVKICLARWRTLLKAVLVVVVPVQVVSTIVNADYTVSSFKFDTSASTTSDERLEAFDQYIGGLGISTVLQICAVGLATAACFRTIAGAYLEENADWRASLSYALGRLPALLLLTLLYVAGVGLGTLLFVAPGIWLYVAWAVAMPVLLVEGLRGRMALTRSFGLVRGRWWRTCGILVAGFVVAGLAAALAQGIFLVGIAGTDDDALVLVLSALAGVVGMTVSTPFQAALLTAVYLDLRVRKEGFDREQLAFEIRVGTAEPDAGPAAPAPLPEPAEHDEDERGEGPLWPPPPGWR